MRKLSKYKETIKRGKRLGARVRWSRPVKKIPKNLYKKEKKKTLSLKTDRLIRTKESIKGNITLLSVSNYFEPGSPDVPSTLWH